MLRTLADATVVSPSNPCGYCLNLPRSLRAAGLRSSLACFLLQALAGDTNALLFVRVGRTQLANIRRNIANLAFVRAADDQLRLFLDGDLNSLRNVKLDRVRLAECECDHLALKFRAVANAHDIEIFLEAGGDAGDRVGHQGARQTMQRAMLFGCAEGVQHPVLLLEGDAARNRNRELTLRPLYFDAIALQRDFNAARQWNWFAPDT